MGLGKTLQSLITISLQILEVFKYQFSSKTNKNGTIISELNEYAKIKYELYSKVLKENIAVIVSPNNLIYHWIKECKSKISTLLLNPIIVNDKVLSYGSLSEYLKSSKIYIFIILYNN